MGLIVIAAFALLMALIPAALLMGNLRVFRPAPALPAAGPEPEVSLLIPARNEAVNIADCVNAALASKGVHLEVIVLDDDSTDETAAIVRQMAAADGRVRLAAAPPLPAGWSGKQRACHELARLARREHLLFIDADVRLAPDAAGRAIAFLQASGAALVSGFPRQQTGSFFEALVLPLIHFVLLGYLPLERMRRSRSPAFGAGCGQFFLTRQRDYRAAGGHAAIAATLHDGILLPRAYRRAGLATDLFDATDVAACRMYAGAGQTWRGLAKNATEAMAAPTAIVPWTVLLFGGQVLPWLLLPAGGVASALGLAGGLIGVGSRWVTARRFQQSRLGALLHPLGVAALLAIQWQALAMKLAARPAQWRGRAYPAGPATPRPSAG